MDRSNTNNEPVKSTTITNDKKWLIAGVSVLGAATIVFASLFTWKCLTGPKSGVWVNTDQNGVLANRDRIFTITQTQSPMNLIPKVLKSYQFTIEKKSFQTSELTNEGQYLTTISIDTKDMYIKKELKNLKTPEVEPTIEYLSYKKDDSKVYYCYKDSTTQEKTSVMTYSAENLEQAKDNFNLMYLSFVDKDDYPYIWRAKNFIDYIYEPRLYGYNFDSETGAIEDDLINEINKYSSLWEQSGESVEMKYQKKDDASIKISNEKSGHIAVEGVDADITTEFELTIDNGLLTNYKGNIAVTPLGQNVTNKYIDEISIKTGSFILDDLSEYFEQ